MPSRDVAPASPTPSSIPGATTPSIVRDLWDMAKPRLTGLVVVTTAVGYFLAFPESKSLYLRPLFATLFGTALVSAAASVLNQWAERVHDQKMARTADRPLATGRLDGMTAAAYALIAGFGGLSMICIETNPIASGIALATLLIYVLIYTPLKRRHSLNTIVGAVPGALPPLIGWAAASGSVPPAAWSLFLILFFWQIPHFLAIAVLYREDYTRAGYRMLPVGDDDGQRTGRMAMLYALALVPVSIFPSILGLGGTIYAVGAFLLSAWFVRSASRFERERSRERARALFLTSIAYLPALLTLLCVDSNDVSRL